jgi:hypothetical protein
MTFPSSNPSVRRRLLTGAAALALAAGGALALTGDPQDSDAERYARATAAADRLAAQAPEQGGPGAEPEKSTEQPRAARRDAEGRRTRPGAMAPFDFGWGYARGAHTDLRQPRPQEWAEAQMFMSRYSPRRTAALDDLPDDERKEGLKRYVFARFRTLMALQKRDRAMYEQRVAQLGVEDQIFGLVSDAAADPSVREGLRVKLREQVSRLVDLDLEGRRRRIDFLKKELARETEELEKGEKNADAQVDRRVNTYSQWAEKWAARKGRKPQQDKSPDVVPEASPKSE